jgi:hypothetical protein
MVNWRIKRARNLKGRYRGDDKSTTFNEAWVAGRSPKKWIYKQWKKLKEWFWNGFYGRN